MLEVRDPADLRSVVAEVPAMSASEVAAAYTREGATVITGGDRPTAGSLAYGCYVSPTIVSVDTKHSLWREEVFGPVIAVRAANGCYTRIKTAAVRFAW